MTVTVVVNNCTYAGGRADGFRKGNEGLAKPQRQYLTVQRTPGSESSSLNPRARRRVDRADGGGGDSEPSSGHGQTLRGSV